MNETAFPDAQLRRDVRTNTVRFLSGGNLSASLEQDADFRRLQAGNQFRDIALAFLAAYRTVFRLEDPASELRATSPQRDSLGLVRVRFQQHVKGVPVWGAELSVHLNRHNSVYLVQGSYVPTPQLAEPFRLSEDDAVRVALQSLGRQRAECAACRGEAVVFVTEELVARPAYVVSAQFALHEGWAVIVDASSGDILRRIPTVQSQRGDNETR